MEHYSKKGSDNMNQLQKPLTINKLVIYMSLGIAALLSITSWGYILFQSRFHLSDLFSKDTLIQTNQLITKLMGLDQDLSLTSRLSSWFDLRHLAYETLLMSICSIGLAGIIALTTCMFASRNFHDDTLFGYTRPALKIIYFLIRSVYSFTRAIPELILAIILMLFFTPGIWVAAIALAIHNTGVLGKLYSECIEDMEITSVKSLQTSGAGGGQLLLYAILPQLLPQFLTYLLYRWEVVIRTTVVVGLVSAAGLGREFRLSFSYFHYADLGLLLLWYVLLVISVDLTCSLLRKLISIRF